MNYRAPLRDIAFVLNELLDVESHYRNLFGDTAPDDALVTAVIEQSARFCEEQLAPLNAIGDREGCQFKEGIVTTPNGFKRAYERYKENGWPSLSGPIEFGGQGLPESLRYITMEMTISANHAWSNYPGLTGGAITTLLRHGDNTLKTKFLPKMISGDWSGTMCLTEPHCGSDLGLIRTSAASSDNGCYRITGAKIFISSGEHDLTENIIHIVLARVVGAPKGTKGLSLFAVPKYLVDESGAIGVRNQLSCGGIEAKMGLHGNATCALNFDGATGYLIGDLHAGLQAMFSYINESRLGVAMHGHGHTEVSYQRARAYAKERLQMRAAHRNENARDADPIIQHPDVRRMLLTQKAFAEGGRMLNYFCALQVDKALQPNLDAGVRAEAENLLAVLTPISKGFLSEVSIEATSLGIQVFGGHGYISENGQEQELRDTRITPIYEGTTAIQGLDLLGRKIFGSNGAVLEPLQRQLKQFIAANASNEYVAMLEEYVRQWTVLTFWIGEAAMKDSDEVNAAAVEYVLYSGYIVLAYFWAQAAVVADRQLTNGGGDSEFYRAKKITCDFYFRRLMPRTLSLAAAIKSGAAPLMALSEVDF